MRIKDKNHITISGWMYSLGLSSVLEVMAFAAVYGFSQDNSSEFKGSITFIQDFLMCSRPTAIKVMKNLEDKGFIVKRQVEDNGVVLNRYSANLRVVNSLNYPQLNNLTTPSKTDLLHIYKDNNNSNNNSSNSLIINNNPIPTTPYIPQGGLESELSRSELIFEEFRKFYKGTKRGLKTEFENFKKKHKDWKEVLPTLLEKYKAQKEAKEKIRLNGGFVPQEKNLQTYLNQRCWEEEINTTNELAKYGTINEESQSDKPHNRLVQKMEEWCEENLSGMF